MEALVVDERRFVRLLVRCTATLRQIVCVRGVK